MNIQDFMETYTSCPFCTNQFKIFAMAWSKSGPQDPGIEASVTQVEDGIRIKLQSDYFVKPRYKLFEFQISIKDGFISHCSNTDQFGLLYDLVVEVSKVCSDHDHSFYQCISFSYDRNESAFMLGSNLERFIVEDTNNEYYMNQTNNQTLLTVCYVPASIVSTKEIRLPHIPFTKFDFHNKSNLLQQINKLLILA